MQVGESVRQSAPEGRAGVLTELARLAGVCLEG